MRIHMPKPDLMPETEKTIDTKRYISTYRNDCRIDTIKLKMVKGVKHINKITYFGTILANSVVKLYDVINLQFPLMQYSDIKRIESVNVTSHPYNHSLPTLIQKRDNELFKNRLMDDNCLNIAGMFFDGISKAWEIRNNIDFDININAFEDNFNIPFGESVHDIIMGISLFMLEIPFKMDIKIDNKYGIEVKNLYASSKDSGVIENTKRNIKRCMDFIHKRFPEFKDCLDKENRHFGIYIHIDYFDIITEIHDYQYKMVHYGRFNISDHFRLMKHVAFNKGGAFGDESFYDASKLGFHTSTYLSYMLNDEDIDGFVKNKEKMYLDNLQEDYNELSRSSISKSY